MKRLLFALALLLSWPAHAGDFWQDDQYTSPDGITNYTLFTNLGPCVTGALAPSGGLSCMSLAGALTLTGSTFTDHDYRIDVGAPAGGTTNDSPAIQAAMNSCPATGCIVQFRPGTYRIKSAITNTSKNGMTLAGYGRDATTLLIDDSGLAGADAFTFTTTYQCGVHDLSFSATAARTAGSYVTVAGGTAGIALGGFGLHAAYFHFDDVDMDSGFNGIEIKDASSSNGPLGVYVRRGHWRNFSANGTGVLMNSTGTTGGAPNGGSFFVEDIWFQGPAIPLAGTVAIKVRGTSDFTLNNVETWGFTNALIVQPPTGASVFSGHIIGCFLDSAGGDVATFTTASGGTIQWIDIAGTWFATSAAGNGLTLTGVTKVQVGGSSRFLNNNQRGLYVNGGTDIAIADSQFDLNGAIDVLVSGSAARVSVEGITAKSPGVNGIQVDNGCTDYTVVGNNLVGSLGLVDNGTTASKVVRHNLPGTTPASTLRGNPAGVPGVDQDITLPVGLGFSGTTLQFSIPVGQIAFGGAAGSLTSSSQLTYAGNTLSNITPVSSSPAATFKNTSASQTDPVVTIESSSAVGSTPLQFKTNGTLRGIFRSDFGGNMVFAGTAGSLFFFTGGDFGTGQEVMKVFNNGHTVVSTAAVGVDLTDPGQLFGVVGGDERVTNDNASAASLWVSNANAGGSAFSQMAAGQSSTPSTSPYIALQTLGSGFTTSGLNVAGAGKLVHVAASAGQNMILSAHGGQDMIFATTTSTTERMRIANGGNVSIANLTAGGVVAATAGTGVLKIGSSADVAGAITWPAVKDILVSTGTTTAPNGSPGFQYDTANDFMEISGGAVVYHFNVGSTPAGNYEAFLKNWAGNTYNVQAVKGGTGVFRPYKITTSAGVTVDEYLQVNGPTAPANVGFITGHTTNANRDHVQFFVGGGSSWDSTNTWFDVVPANTSFTGTVGIWATERLRTSTYTGSSTPVMTEATTLYIDGAPSTSGFTTSLYALHVAAGLAQFDGTMTVVSGGVATIAAGTGKLSFFGNGLSSQLTVSGSRGGNAALASLLTQLNTYGIIVDGSTP